ncbi:hypothetical protein [Deinococcus sonorensis]|uniref:Uncharacterized protein n=2 Tax=Deinococcus sonorensis TaxID=309891 RepID=A0AAU7U563_9DEIO
MHQATARPRSFTRFVLPALLIALPTCTASAAGVPASLVGEWFNGAHLPGEAYSTPALATGTSARFVFRQDGTYEFTKLAMTHIPGYAPMSTLLIACESLDVTTERGTFKVQGSRIALTPSSLKTITGMSPASLNSGCKRFPGVSSTRQPGAAESDVWKVAGNRLTLGTGQSSSTWDRRTPTAPQTSTALPAELRGEWNSGRISPVEYYNVTTGKWAEASGTSVILRMNANLTYERTGLLVVTTYGCTSKLLVQERGTVAVSGATLTFTPNTSASTGYTCSPDKVSSARNTVKPYTERALVEIHPDGQHVLSLASGSGTTRFNRPIGTPPESTPGTGRGTVTPPAPGSAGSPTPSHSTPNSTAAPAPSPTPARWTATGDWDVVLTLGGRTYRAVVSLEDDSPRLLGSIDYHSSPIEAINGNSATGELALNLAGDADETIELVASGRFTGDRYQGQVRGKRENLGTGSLTMTRR